MFLPLTGIDPKPINFPTPLELKTPFATLIIASKEDGFNRGVRRRRRGRPHRGGRRLSVILLRHDSAAQKQKNKKKGERIRGKLISGLPRRRRRWYKNFSRREALPMVVGERGGVERKHSD
ncbi:hypothetical protein V8G54_007448 [Vigna mungo]|uniref:Uncharacterized protein n=1 Tax=Vigna mungo TaxID=3915 RepID=A0AAQ3P134_VIGMU